MNLADILRAAGEALSESERAEKARLFEEDCLVCLAARLEEYHKAGLPEAHPPPHWDEETTPAPEEAFAPFARLLQRVDDHPNDSLEEHAKRFASAVRKTDLRILLTLLGRRETPASINDARGFAPPRNTLMASAASSLAEGGLSVSGRALTKHSDGDAGSFWGEAKGSPTELNADAARVVERIVDERTWWNVFTHFQHETVFECRTRSGHGARWTGDGETFIGFLDPFDAEQRAENHADNEPAGVVETEPVGKITRDELIARYEAGERVFHGADLLRVDLSRLDLRGIDLTGSSFKGAKLYGTDFGDAILNECNFAGMYLAKTELTGASLRRSDLQNCKLEGTQWRDVDVQSARLSGANLRGAKLSGCRMRGTGLSEADFTGATLENMKLYGTYAERAHFNKSHLRHCRFHNARLMESDFTEATLEHCRFEQADLTAVNFTSARLDHVGLAEGDLSNAVFAGATMTDANLERAKLAKAQFTGCDLSDSDLSRADLSRADLAGAKLVNTKLDHADLTRVTLRKADLSGATLVGADLEGADVAEATVDHRTNFEAARTMGVDFGTNWAVKQRVSECAHELTIRQFCRRNPVVGFLWGALLGYGKKNWLLLFWGGVVVLLFAGLMAVSPDSFDFGEKDPGFFEHVQNSLAVFVTLDLAIDRGTDGYGRGVMLFQMLLSYIMLGFLASLFSSIFPRAPD